MDSHVIQVTNIAPSTTDEQVYTLFNFLGPIEEYAVYPKVQDPGNAGTKVAFIKFQEGASVGIAQHLTNTVFIDRPLICVPYNEGVVPDESVAMQFVGPASAVAGMAGMQAGSMDPSKLDEIRRTIYIGNLDSKTATAEQLMTFFSSCGEVKFVRMAGDETQPTRFAFVEFADVDYVQKAMALNGSLFGDRPLKINHSNNAIVKPTGKTPDTSSNREIDEAMRRVREAQTLISLALEPDTNRSSKRARSRSRSRSRHRRRRSRSRDRSRRRRSRSRSHGRSRRSRSRDRSSRRSRRSRSRSKDRRRKRSRSRSSRRKSSSRSPSRKSSKSHKSSKDRKRDKDHKHSSSGKHGDRKKDEKNDDNKVKNSEETEKKQNGKEVES